MSPRSNGYQLPLMLCGCFITLGSYYNEEEEKEKEDKNIIMFIRANTMTIKTIIIKRFIIFLVWGDSH